MTRAYTEAPLCLRNPKPIGGVCQAYISQLGGGLLPADRMRIEIEAQSQARLFLGSQAATRIFKSPAGTCRQNIQGLVNDSALVIYMPDATTPFAKARFEQNQIWTLHAGGRLALGEILQAGRLSRGEVFAFASYKTAWRVNNSQGRPILLDRISLEPGLHGAAMPGCFAMPDPSGAPGENACFTQWASFAFCGRGWEGMEKQLRSAYRVLPLWPWGIAGPDEVERRLDRNLLVALWRKDEDVLLLRALAVNREAMQGVLEPLYQALAREEVLGFSPWARKF